MLKLHETGSRHAQQSAAIDEIEQFADDLEARQFASLCRRADRLQRNRPGKAGR